jgi:hypothetical protein
MDLEIALLSFHGVTSATEAFADARERASAEASWPKQVGIVEHHHDGHLVLRGTFAGHYVDLDEAVHVSQHGAAEGLAIGALGALLGPPGFAVGIVTGLVIGSQLGKPSEADPEPEPLANGLRAAVPRSGSAVVLIAGTSDVEELVSATAEQGARVMRRALTAEEAAAVEASLDGFPCASPGPSTQGEEAEEASEAGAQ